MPLLSLIDLLKYLYASCRRINRSPDEKEERTTFSKKNKNEIVYG